MFLEVHEGTMVLLIARAAHFGFFALHFRAIVDLLYGKIVTYVFDLHLLL